VGKFELFRSRAAAQDEKALSYPTDTMDRVTVSGGKSNPVGAAAARLKDIIRIFQKCG